MRLERVDDLCQRELRSAAWSPCSTQVHHSYQLLGLPELVGAESVTNRPVFSLADIQAVCMSVQGQRVVQNARSRRSIAACWECQHAAPGVEVVRSAASASDDKEPGRQHAWHPAAQRLSGMSQPAAAKTAKESIAVRLREVLVRRLMAPAEGRCWFGFGSHGPDAATRSRLGGSSCLTVPVNAAEPAVVLVRLWLVRLLALGVQPQ